MRKALVLSLLFLMPLAVVSYGAESPVLAGKTKAWGSLPGKIIFESNRESLNDQIELKGRKYGLRSIFLLEQGKIKKIARGCEDPRWSEDGEKIVCVEAFLGKIVVVKKNGNVIREIEPRYYPSVVDWHANEIVYAGWDRVEGLTGKRFLSIYDLETNRERVLHETRMMGSIENLDWRPTENVIALNLYDRLKDEPENESYIARFNVNTKKMEAFFAKAYCAVFLPDRKTMIISTNRDPGGKKIYNLGWGSLARYNIQTKEFKVIRPSAWIRNMRLSRDGKYLLVAEDTSNKGVAISVYAIDDLVNPVYQIPTATTQRGEASQDTNADWFF